MTAVPDERLLLLIGQPTLEYTTRLLEAIEIERKEMRREIKSDWAGTKPYRLKKGTRLLVQGEDGQPKLFVGGDVVPLTSNQAKNWSDRIEPLEDEKRKAELKTTKRDPNAPLTLPADAVNQPSTHGTEVALRKKQGIK